MEKFAIPNVKAIIEKIVAGERWIVLQTRNKPPEDPYTQRYELPGGKLRAYEGIKQALEREIKEECGLVLEEIFNPDIQEISEDEDRVETIKPFSTYQITKGPYPSMGLIFICRAKGQLIENGDETSNPFWIKRNSLIYLVEEKPKDFTMLDRAILLDYLRSPVFNREGKRTDRG